ncbi:MAG: ABC transporter substrate-binding protein [Pseudomonadota bacterium]
MKISARIRAAVLLVFVSVSLPCAAAPSSPRSFVRSLEMEMRAMLRAGDFRRANLLFAEHFDMATFGRRCLADHWEELTPAERERFLDLLERNIRKRMNEKMIFTKEDTDFRMVPGKTGVVDGLTKIDNALKVRRGTIGLDIFLVREGGRYRVADYDFDGALLSRNYRGHFNFVMRQYGKGGLFARLEEKLKSE